MSGELITWRKKHEIRNNWCDKLCSIFNYYQKTREKLQIRTPLYTVQVLSTFGLIEFNDIDFTENKIDVMENTPRTKNEGLIYKCFDELIERENFIGDYLVEFREYFNHKCMPF